MEPLFVWAVASRKLASAEQLQSWHAMTHDEFSAAISTASEWTASIVDSHFGVDADALPELTPLQLLPPIPEIITLPGTVMFTWEVLVDGVWETLPECLVQTLHISYIMTHVRHVVLVVVGRVFPHPAIRLSGVCHRARDGTPHQNSGVIEPQLAGGPLGIRPREVQGYTEHVPAGEPYSQFVL